MISRGIKNLRGMVSNAEAYVARNATGRHRLVGLSVLRVGFGASSVITYLGDLPTRHIIYGPDGATSFDSFLKRQSSPDTVFSLYSVASGQLWFEIVYFTGLIAALAWSVFGGRLLAVINLVFVWSLLERNPMVTDGGDNLQRIVMILLVFTTTNAYFSPLSHRVRARLRRSEGDLSLTNCIHNVAATVIIFQICVVYFVASFWKVVDTRWREGNALYYISQIDNFEYSPIFGDLMHNAVLATMAAYLTIIVQMSIPVAALTRRRWLREAIILVAVGMHLGIMFGMGLVTFGLIMISADTMILRDSDYRILAKFARVRLRTFGSKSANEKLSNDSERTISSETAIYTKNFADPSRGRNT